MILLLDSSEGVRLEDLLARPSKTGQDSARGPVAGGGAALSALGDGDKLHLVGSGTGSEVGGYTAEGLVAHLGALGLSRVVRLKQIHMIAADAGTGSEQSFAARFDTALRAAGFQVSEIKAPMGRVRCDPAGKIWIESRQGWLPSSPELNYYAGPAIRDKHRKSG
jgi:Peptidase C80 family